MLIININSNRSMKRPGISIIEVLTSMAVATIGVFGVMVMIPFAVSQSQRGLDSDMANVAGRNALEDMQTQGVFRATQTAGLSGEILDSIVFPQPTAAPPSTADLECAVTDFGAIANYSLSALGMADSTAPVDARFNVGLVHLDPIGVAYRGGPVTSFAVSPAITIPSVTLRNGDTLTHGTLAGIRSRFSPAEAFNFCATRDDLVFGNDRFDTVIGGYVETDEIAPPQQYHDISTGELVKRQSQGRISWSVMLNPSKNMASIKATAAAATTPPSHFKAYVLTYSQRSFSGEPTFTGGLSTTISTVPPDKYGFPATPPATPTPNLRQIPLDSAINPDASFGKGSWVMLINLLPVPDYSLTPQLPISINGNRADEAGYDKQIMFARVTKVDRTANTVTIDGGPFEIFPPGDTRAGGETHLVHLPDVVNVFERTIPIER